jgi:hypothetical protein
MRGHRVWSLDARRVGVRRGARVIAWDLRLISYRFPSETGRAQLDPSVDLRMRILGKDALLALNSSGRQVGKFGGLTSVFVILFTIVCPHGDSSHDLSGSQLSALLDLEDNYRCHSHYPGPAALNTGGNEARGLVADEPQGYQWFTRVHRSPSSLQVHMKVIRNPDDPGDAN